MIIAPFYRLRRPATVRQPLPFGKVRTRIGHCLYAVKCYLCSYITSTDSPIWVREACEAQNRHFAEVICLRLLPYYVVQQQQVSLFGADRRAEREACEAAIRHFAEVICFRLLPYYVVQQQQVSLFLQYLSAPWVTVEAPAGVPCSNQAPCLSLSAPCGCAVNASCSLPCGCKEHNCGYTSAQSVAHLAPVGPCAPDYQHTHDGACCALCGQTKTECCLMCDCGVPRQGPASYCSRALVTGGGTPLKYAGVYAEGKGRSVMYHFRISGSKFGKFRTGVEAAQARFCVLHILCHAPGQIPIVALKSYRQQLAQQLAKDITKRWVCRACAHCIPGGLAMQQVVTAAIAQLEGTLVVTADAFCCCSRGSSGQSGQTGLFCAPESVGLHCDPQWSAQCGAHAVNALLGSHSIHGPDYCVPHLERVTAQTKDGAGQFDSSGNYTVTVLNHWLYEHMVIPTAVFQHVVDTGQVGVHNFPHLSQQEMLAKCPPGCKALLMWYKHNGSIKHYKAWMCSSVDQQWYECESIGYRDTGLIKRLQPSDWSTFDGCVYCLVQGDAYLTCETLVRPQLDCRLQLPVYASGATWVDGTSVQLSDTPLRSIVTFPTIDTDGLRTQDDNAPSADMQRPVPKRTWAQVASQTRQHQPQHITCLPVASTPKANAVQNAVAAMPTQDAPAVTLTPAAELSNSKKAARSKGSNNLAARQQHFLAEIENGASYECACCEQTWFKKGVRKLTAALHDKIKGKGRGADIRPPLSKGLVQYLCHTCCRYLEKGEMPKFSQQNGMVFPHQPHVVKRLSDLEGTLVAINIPFMTMFTRKTAGGQWAQHGAVVNVPSDNHLVQSVLPRLLSDSHCFLLSLKRKLAYKTPYMMAAVHPGLVMQAMRYLVQQTLYRDHKIQIHPRWAEELRRQVASHEMYKGYIVSNVQQQQPDLPVDQSEPCWECGLLECTRENDMIFCDQCNQCYHMDCCGVKEIPSGAWYCLNCSVDNTPCSVCGLVHFTADDPFVFCDLCEEGFHIKCIGISPPPADCGWVCRNCHTPRRLKAANCSDSDDDYTPASRGPVNGKQHNLRAREVHTPGNSDTLLTTWFDDPAMLHDQIVNIAPTEQHTPVGFFAQPNIEECCFPKEFCGQPRCTPVQPVHYSEICKWELRHKDRRFAINPRNIFFKLKKHLIQQVQHGVWHRARVSKLGANGLTAGQCRSKEMRKALTDGSIGYKDFVKLKGSPAYLAHCKKVVYAMIRQLAGPTWFTTFNAAETNWPELMAALYKLKHGKDITPEELDRLPMHEKFNLIKEDYVTCARHFDCRWHSFWQHIVEKGTEPLGDVTDSYFRTEFQHRGSPHMHGLVWTKDAPQYDPKNPNDPVLLNFIDNHMSCAVSGLREDALWLQLQWHKHKPYCQKSKHKHCTGEYPRPPMRATCILQPLRVDEAGGKAELHRLQNEWTEMHLRMDLLLKDVDPDKDIPIDHFYNMLATTEEHFTRCLRASLKRPKVYLQRAANEVWINPYIKNGGGIWAANHDIQFVLDPYAAANYVVSYMMKENRGMSELMEQATREACAGEMELPKGMRHVANKWLRAQEVTAQEAVYHLLQLDFTRSSRMVRYIDTSPPSERQVALMAERDIETLPDDSNIILPGFNDMYKQRTGCMERVTLADYGCYYERSTRKPDTEGDDSDESDADDDECDDAGVPEMLPQQVPGMRMRQKPRILRYRNYSLEQDAENYYRERLMLFTAWRDEEELMGPYSSYAAAYAARADEVEEVANRYDAWHGNFDKIVDDVEQLAGVHEEDDADDDVEADDAVADDAARNLPSGEDPLHTQDVGGDLETNKGARTDRSYAEKTAVLRQTFDRAAYYDLARMLNVEQRAYFYHTLQRIQRGAPQFVEFLSGGAGVGKSVLTTAITQGVKRWALQQPDADPSCIHVLVMAYTNKASANVRGTTPFTGLGIPVSQDRFWEMTALADGNGRKAQYQAALRQLKLIIIDEISFIDADLLGKIDKRLRQIMGTDQPFGGVHVLFVGDLFQLTPGLGNDPGSEKMVFGGGVQPPSDLVADVHPAEEPHQEPMTLRSKRRPVAPLPPPKKRRVFRVNHYAHLAPSFWQEHVLLFELTEIMRQKDAKAWAELLNRLRENQLTNEDEQVLLNLVVHPPMCDFHHCDYPKLVPHQFMCNKDLEHHNGQVLNHTKGMAVKLVARDSVVSWSPHVGTEKQRCAAKQIFQAMANKRKGKANNLVECLQVKVGSKVEICTTHDATDHLSNGYEGTVRAIDIVVPGDAKTAHTIWVEFVDPCVGQHRRQAHERYYADGTIPNTWTPIMRVPFTADIRLDNLTIKVERSQFPLQLCAGRTVNRSQGVTEHDGGAVRYKSQRKGKQQPAFTRIPYHAHYVTLSRYPETHITIPDPSDPTKTVTKQRVYIIEDAMLHRITLHPGVVTEMARLRTHRRVQMCYPPLSFAPGPHFTIATHNASSAHAHMADIAQDYDLQRCDLLILTETRATARDVHDMYKLQQLPHCHASHADHGQFKDQHGRPFHGIMAYSRTPWLHPCTTLSIPGLDLCVCSVASPIGAILVCGIYRSPRDHTSTNVAWAMQHAMGAIQQHTSTCPFAHKACVIMGDWNVDMHPNSADHMQQTLTQCMAVEGYVLTSNPSQPTCDRGSHLDSIWCKWAAAPPSLLTGVSPTYWSDHGIAWLQLCPALACPVCGTSLYWQNIRKHDTDLHIRCRCCSQDAG